MLSSIDKDDLSMLSWDPLSLLPCGPDLLGTWKNKQSYCYFTLLISPSQSITREQNRPTCTVTTSLRVRLSMKWPRVSIYFPFKWNAWPICRIGSPRLLCPSNHLYTWQVRGHPRVKGLFWEQNFFTELAWGLYCRNHGELCSFVFQVYVSLFHCWPVCHYHICSRLWPLLRLKPGPQVHVLFT